MCLCTWVRVERVNGGPQRSGARAIVGINCPPWTKRCPDQQIYTKLCSSESLCDAKSKLNECSYLPHLPSGQKLFISTTKAWNNRSACVDAAERARCDVELQFGQSGLRELRCGGRTIPDSPAHKVCQQSALCSNARQGLRKWACETLASTCVPFPFVSWVCVSRSHKCCWSVARRAEQKLLKAFGPRLGRRSCNRQLRFWDVCSACKRKDTQIKPGNNNNNNNSFLSPIHPPRVAHSWNVPLHQWLMGTQGKLRLVGAMTLKTLK